jgi:hypothetical protein
MAISQSVPKWDWKREHPLPHRGFGKHSIDEMRCGVGHPSARARRTETTPLARERNQPLFAAALAANPQKTPGEDPAIQERTKLALHKTRHRPARLLRVGKKGLEVLPDDAVEKCLLRRAARVLGQGGPSRDRGRGRPRMTRADALALLPALPDLPLGVRSRTISTSSDPIGR